MLSAHHQYRPLGKKPARYDARTLQLAKYIGAHLPPAPGAQIWSSKVASWPMYLNDTIGDCAIAGPGHMIEAWSANSGSLVKVADADILAAYEAVGGYNPKIPSTDGGCVMLDVLKYWRSVGIGKHKIGAFASVSPHSTAYVQDAIYLFGGIDAGFDLPMTAQNQAVWDVVAGAAHNPNAKPGSWGGHCVNLVDYDARSLTCVTWGGLKKMTWAFLKAYCDELYAIISQDFLASSKAPNGFDLATLTADLGLLR